MLSLEGWINAISTICFVIFGVIFGSWVFYKSRKLNARLLSYAGLMILFMALVYLGVFCDAITIIITGNNMPNPFGIIAIMMFIWVPFVIVLAFFITSEIIIPEKIILKRVLLFISVVSGIIYVLYMLLDPTNSYIFEYPSKSGENLIRWRYVFGSIPFIVITVVVGIIIIFTGIGFTYKIINSQGVVRKKFFYLFLAINLYGILAAIDSLINPGFAQIFIRIGLMSSFLFWYLGLREESAEPIEKRPRKEIKIESDLFRLTKRPEQITEEEVTYYKEQELCLVCKNKVGGFNIFICENCRALYCEKCARALIGLENACWVCGEPIDKSKPSKTFEKEEELDIEISEKTKTNIKTKDN